MTNRITEIEIAGRKYPLNFSLAAAEKVAERYGDITNIGDAFTDKPVAEMISEMAWIFALLIEQGAAYKRIVDGEDVKGVTQDDLKVIMGFADFMGMQETLFAAMAAGMGREVEVEPDPKNAKTTQSK